MVITLSELYQRTRRALLTQEDPDSAGFLARELVCRATGKTKEQILAQMQNYVSDDVCADVSGMTERILAGEPLAYILGEWDFYGMRLFVNSHVLIPRDDTCAVTELAINRARLFGEKPRILDLCTGSGCIGLAIATHIKDARVVLADVSVDALQVAKRNIASQGLSGRVSCVQANALEQPAPFLGKFDMIVSNPPYVTAQEMTELPVSVADYEPHIALYGGEDGLEFYKSIAERYTAALKPDGYLCFEFGMDQGNAVCDLLEQNGFTILERSRDYNDRERAVLARYDRKDA